MATDNSQDPAKAAKLAQQIVTILMNEESTVRQRAIQAAMMLLGEKVPQGISQELGRAENAINNNRNDAIAGNDDLASFFNRDEEMKPADHAYLCAAYHFSQFGLVPFSLAEIRSIAADAGVVVPDRVDMTFSAATKKGKKLFQNAGRGSFKPTAAGGLEFGERWGVRPGRKVKAPSEGTV